MDPRLHQILRHGHAEHKLRAVANSDRFATPGHGAAQGKVWEVRMLLRIIRVACVICLLAPLCVAPTVTGAQAQSASAPSSAGKAAAKKSTKKPAKTITRNQPAIQTGSGSGAGGWEKHDGRHGY
jgi:hypothetical protein